MSRPDTLTPHRVLVAKPIAAVGRIVRRWPVLVVVAILALTAGFASFSPKAATNGDGMLPDSPEIEAMVTLSELFATETEEMIQILVKSEGQGIVGRDGLEAAATIEQALRESSAGELVADQPERPGIVSWMFPAQAMTDLDVAAIDDQDVLAAYESAITQLPEELSGMAAGLLADGAEPARADAALTLVFLRTDTLPDPVDEVAYTEALTEAQLSLAEALDGVELPPGVSAEPFSMYLLFESVDDFDSELAQLFVGAFAIIVLILAFVYWVRPGLGMSRTRSGRRSAADVLLSMAAIVMAVLWMNGVAALLGPDHLDVIGPMSSFAQVIPVLLIGLGVDYAIHLTSRYREEVGAGASVSQSVDGAVRTVGVALLLATVATAVGFLTNVVSPIPAVGEFGVLVAVGIVASFVIMLTFIPSARLLLDRRAERHGHLPAAALGQTSERLLPELMGRTSVLARQAPVATLAVTLLLAGVGVYGMTNLETRFSETDMIPEDSPVLATVDEVTDRFSGGFSETTEVLLTGDLATPAAHNALARSHVELGSAQHVMQLGGQPAAASVVTTLGQMVAPGPDGLPLVPAVAEVAADIGVAADLTVPNDADIDALYAAMYQAAPEAMAPIITEGFDAGRVTLQTSAGDERGGEIAVALADAFAPLEAAGVVAVATSNPIVTDVIVTALQDSQAASMAITLLVAMLLLVAVFTYEHRRPMLGVITVAPVVLVVLWTFGLMAATGIPFGPITALIAAIGIGIGLPYTIHVTHRFIEDRDRYADVGDAIRSTIRHTGGAMAGSALTTSAGFGILITSSLLPFRQLGLVTVYAVVFALLAATLVLPSMLVLWHRWHAGGRGSATRAESEAELVSA